VLKAVTFAVDGRGEQTSLVEATMKHLKLETPQELIGWAYTDMEWSRFASVSILAEQEATKGDKIAMKIIENSAKKLANSVFPVHKTLELGDEFAIVLAGGILTHEGSIIGSKAQKILQEKYPKAKITFPTVDPCYAAALLAKNQSELLLLEKHVKISNII